MPMHPSEEVPETLGSAQKELMLGISYSEQDSKAPVV